MTSWVRIPSSRFNGICSSMERKCRALGCGPSDKGSIPFRYLMNIFILDEDPEQAARWLCDQHIVKMPIETAQLLSTAHHITNSELICHLTYKPTHINHPASVWVRSSLDNYRWLVRHGMELCNEYTRRYNKTHASQVVIEWAKNNEPDLPRLGLLPFVQCIADIPHKANDPVGAYREFYLLRKRFARWNHSKIPSWWK